MQGMCEWEGGFHAHLQSNMIDYARALSFWHNKAKNNEKAKENFEEHRERERKRNTWKFRAKKGNVEQTISAQNVPNISFFFFGGGGVIESLGQKRENVRADPVFFWALCSTPIIAEVVKSLMVIVLGNMSIQERSATPSLSLVRQEKRAERLTFWVRRPPSGARVFHAKGWGSKCRNPKEFVLPLGTSENFAAISRTPGDVGQVCANMFIREGKTTIKKKKNRFWGGGGAGGREENHPKPLFIRKRVPLCCKNMCCVSRFCTDGRGAAGSRCKQCPGGPVKQNASPGEQSEAPRPRWKPGQEQHPGPENQDSQHMLEQPRGSFLDLSSETPRQLKFESAKCIVE